MMSCHPPPDGWRTFLIVWGLQAVSVFGSPLTFFYEHYEQFPNTL